MISKKTCIRIILIGILITLVKWRTIFEKIQESPCALESPKMMSQLWKEPLDCSVCSNSTSIDELFTVSQEEFEEKYGYSGRPVIIRGAARNWSAMNEFDYNFFRKLNDRTFMTDCQFLTYNDEFQDLNEALNMDEKRIETGSKSQPWYFGWAVCDPSAVNTLRSYYEKPYFLSPNSENYIVDWIFMGSTGFGANLHIDNVHLPSWQAQIKGIKKWTIQTPTECLYKCQETFEVDMFPGDIIVLDTNLWYHATEVLSDEISVTVGAEYD